MGIIKGVTTTFGIDAPEAYHRIKSVRGKNGGDIRYEVETFYSTEAKDNGSEPLQTNTHLVPGDLRSSIGLITELYNILKTEEAYVDSEDVFEADFFPHIDSYITNAYLLSAIDVTNFDAQTMSISDGILTGRFIVDGYIVNGTLTGAEVNNVVFVNNGYKGGFITNGHLDGYVTQIL